MRARERRGDRQTDREIENERDRERGKAKGTERVSSEPANNPKEEPGCIGERLEKAGWGEEGKGFASVTASPTDENQGMNRITPRSRLYIRAQSPFPSGSCDRAYQAGYQSIQRLY